MTFHEIALHENHFMKMFMKLHGLYFIQITYQLRKYLWVKTKCSIHACLYFTLEKCACPGNLPLPQGDYLEIILRLDFFSFVDISISKFKQAIVLKESTVP